MSRWMAQRPQTIQTKSGGDEKQEQTSGSNQRTSGRRGHLKQVGGIGMLLHHSEDFNLTEAQEEKLLKKQLEFELEKVDLEAAVKKAKITVRALMRDVQAAEPSVMSAIDQLAVAEGNLRKMRYSHLKAGRKVLNEQQRNHLQKFHLQQSRQKAKAMSGGDGDDS
jgi:hypothetical protein